MKIFKSLRMARHQHGISLVISLVMMIVIGLTAASVMRGVSNSERVTNNLRLEALANQYAEAGLKYCESELAKADAARVASLQNANLPTAASVVSWDVSTTWVGGSTSYTLVPSDRLRSDDSTLVLGSSTQPQCFAQIINLPSGGTATMVTSRGFSPDYQADNTGKTIRGSVVWLQSTLIN